MVEEDNDRNQRDEVISFHFLTREEPSIDLASTISLADTNIAQHHAQLRQDRGPFIIHLVAQSATGLPPNVSTCEAQ